LEVALCVLAGDRDQQIAAELAISRSTVRRCVRSILATFRLRDRDELRREFPT